MVTCFFSQWKDCKKEWTIHLKVILSPGLGEANRAEVLNIHCVYPFSWYSRGLNAYKNIQLSHGCLSAMNIPVTTVFNSCVKAILSLYPLTLSNYQNRGNNFIQKLNQWAGWILWDMYFFSTSKMTKLMISWIQEFPQRSTRIMSIYQGSIC